MLGTVSRTASRQLSVWKCARYMASMGSTTRGGDAVARAVGARRLCSNTRHNRQVGSSTRGGTGPSGGKEGEEQTVELSDMDDDDLWTLDGFKELFGEDMELDFDGQELDADDVADLIYSESGIDSDGDDTSAKATRYRGSEAGATSEQTATAQAPPPHQAGLDNTREMAILPWHRKSRVVDEMMVYWESKGVANVNQRRRLANMARLLKVFRSPEACDACLLALSKTIPRRMSRLLKAVAQSPVLLHLAATPERLESRLERLAEALRATRGVVERTVMTTPQLLMHKPQTIEAKIRRLGELLPGIDVSIVVKRYPRVLLFDMELGVASKIEMLGKLLPSLDVVKMLWRQPSLLAYDMDNFVRARIQRLDKLLGPGNALRAIERNPALLCSDERSMEIKLEAIARMFDMQPGSAEANAFISRAPWMLQRKVEGPSGLEERIGDLESTLPFDLDIKELVFKHPMLLTVDPSLLVAKCRLVQTLFGIDDDDVGSIIFDCPQFITAGFSPLLRAFFLARPIPASHPAAGRGGEDEEADERKEVEDRVAAAGVVSDSIDGKVVGTKKKKQKHGVEVAETKCVLKGRLGLSPKTLFRKSRASIAERFPQYIGFAGECVTVLVNEYDYLLLDDDMIKQFLADGSFPRSLQRINRKKISVFDNDITYQRRKDVLRSVVLGALARCEVQTVYELAEPVEVHQEKREAEANGTDTPPELVLDARIETVSDFEALMNHISIQLHKRGIAMQQLVVAVDQVLKMHDDHELPVEVTNTDTDNKNVSLEESESG